MDTTTAQQRKPYGHPELMRAWVGAVLIARGRWRAACDKYGLWDPEVRRAGEFNRRLEMWGERRWPGVSL